MDKLNIYMCVCVVNAKHYSSVTAPFAKPQPEPGYSCRGTDILHRMVVLAWWCLCVYMHIWCHGHFLYNTVLK